MRRWWESQDGLSRFAWRIVIALAVLFAAYWIYVLLFHEFR
jgi:hypothetical protein